uniref:Uncharacterized protein n=1 Tax=Arundo donax TaxID=35708 RepID=A0A0A9E5W2_ARUDO
MQYSNHETFIFCPSCVACTLFVLLDANESYTVQAENKYKYQTQLSKLYHPFLAIYRQTRTTSMIPIPWRGRVKGFTSPLLCIYNNYDEDGEIKTQSARRPTPLVDVISSNKLDYLVALIKRRPWQGTRGWR